MIITGRKISEDTNRMLVKCRNCKSEFFVTIEDLTKDEEHKNYYKFPCPECEAVNRKALGSFKKSIQDALTNPHIIPLEELYVEEEPEEKTEYERDNEGRYVPIRKNDPYKMEVKCRICGRRLKIEAQDLTPDEDQEYYIFHCRGCGAINKKHFTMLVNSVRERVEREPQPEPEDDEEKEE